MIVIGMFLDLRQVCLQGILGHALKIDVTRGMNAIAFVDRSIPSHGCNHLLTVVIHGESLLGLLIRPASVAHSASVMSRADLPKYPRAAASAPYMPPPK